MSDSSQGEIYSISKAVRRLSQTVDEINEKQKKIEKLLIKIAEQILGESNIKEFL